MEPLLTEAYYHIYNHANGNENLFLEDENYRFFLAKYEKYMVPVVDTLAYCLMPNHFHLMIQIKPHRKILDYMKKFPAINRYNKLQAVEEKDAFVSGFVSKQFANLFSSYTQGFNKVYERMGSLFIKNFKRKRIVGDDYFTNLILYIHLNPVKHGFVDAPDEWKFSSYNTILSSRRTFLQRTTMIDWFDGIENFKYVHLDEPILFLSSKLWKSMEME